MDIRQTFHELLLITFLLCMDSGLSFKDDEDYFDEPSFNRCPWIRNKLKNGRVRYRYKGRVAKFLCDSGFELAGKRSSTCVRGQWSNPIPVCVARGCNRVNSIANGRITEMYRGALLVYDCNPGYVLDGSVTIHCDGRRWSASPPLCVIATEKPETYCDFENPDLCGWSQDPNHDFDWQRNQFSTPSGHVGTGPAFDHTFGESKGGFYLFIEASSPRKRNDAARLFSPVFPPDLSGGCFIFWYHMYGATTGSLRVYLKPESHVFDELMPNWEKHGDQGNQWLKGHVIVPVLHENFQIVIEGIRGESYVGDSAIDDVRLTTNLCGIDDNSTDTTETTDQYSCRGRCQESGSESSCGCNANCIDEPNFCCRDYYTICTTGNSTTIQNTDEPLPEDYTTSSSVTTHSTSYTTLQIPEEKITSTENLQTEKFESINDTSSIRSSASTPPATTPPTTSMKVNTSTIKPIPVTTEHLSEETSKETRISTETTTSTDIIPSTMLKTESSTTSTSITSTQYLSTDTSTTTTSTTQSTTPLKTTITSTTPQTTSTTQQTTIPITQKTTTSEKTESTPTKTSTIISALSTTLETTSQTVPIPIIFNNSTTAVSNFSISEPFSTNLYASSSSAATTSNTEPIRVSTTTLSSTRRTYNLRPRNRTVSSTALTNPMPSTMQTPLTTYTPTKESTSVPSFTTTLHLTSWFRYSISFPKQQSTTSFVKLPTTTHLADTSTRRPVTSQTTIENLPQTTKFSSRFTRPTKSPLPKTSDFYESKAKTDSSNSSVPIVVSVVIVALICITAGLAYYFRKQRSKRQSKMSDDSEMRFLPESDYMEYSDASALDKILVK